jgi:SAM-dependent methyltransferase
MAWFDDYFKEAYNLAYISLYDREKAQKECEFIKKMLDMRPEHEILDIPCGFGRHAAEFTRQGYKITGMEYHPVQIKKAKEYMENEGVSFDIIQADMRNIPHKNRYDRLYNFFTSFGYFNDEENEKTIGQFHEALKPGGLLLIETMNRDFDLKIDSDRSIWRKVDGSIELNTQNLDPLTSILTVNRVIINIDKSIYETQFQLRVYSPHELISILKKHNFEIVKICDREGNDIKIYSSRIVMVAKKIK